MCTFSVFQTPRYLISFRIDDEIDLFIVWFEGYKNTVKLAHYSEFEATYKKLNKQLNFGIFFSKFDFISEENKNLLNIHSNNSFHTNCKNGFKIASKITKQHLKYWEHP